MAMMAVPIDELALHPRERACCRRAGLLDAERILCKPSADVEKLLKDLVSADGVARIQRAAAVQQAPQLVSALDVVRSATSKPGSNVDDSVTPSTTTPYVGRIKPPCFSTGDADIDALLGGGVLCGSLTEIVGKSGTGKTQIMLQTAIFTALAFHTSKEVRLKQGELDACRRQNGGMDELVHAIEGYGILTRAERKSVALIIFDGQAEAQMLTRRVGEMCDALIKERWEAAAQCRRQQDEAQAAGGAKRRRGAFSRSEDRRYSLPEAQATARRELFANLHVATPTTYAVLELYLKRDMAVLAKRLVDDARAPLGLILIDDITSIVQEAAKEMTEKVSEATLTRSRLCCELSDSLKHLAASCAVSSGVTSTSIRPPSPAILVVNHVTSVLDRHREYFLPIVEQNLLGPGGQDNRSQRSAHGCTISDEQTVDLTLAFQELQFGGVAAQLDESLFHESRQNLRKGGKLVEVADGILSSLNMSSMHVSWVNCVNVRIFLMHTTLCVQLPTSERKRLVASRLKLSHAFTVRRAVSVVNPFAAAGHGTGPGVKYVICPSGVHSLSTLQLDGAPAAASSELLAEEVLWSSVGGDEMDFAAILEECESRANVVDVIEDAPLKRLREA